MRLNIGSSSYDKPTDPNAQDRLANLAAHEFGHVLGIFDAYGYPLTREARPERADAYGVMRSALGYELNINDTEIKMMLYAFSRNRLQTYEYTAYSGEVSTVFFQDLDFLK